MRQRSHRQSAGCLSQLHPLRSRRANPENKAAPPGARPSSLLTAALSLSATVNHRADLGAYPVGIVSTSTGRRPVGRSLLASPSGLPCPRGREWERLSFAPGCGGLNRGGPALVVPRARPSRHDQEAVAGGTCWPTSPSGSSAQTGQFPDEMAGNSPCFGGRHAVSVRLTARAAAEPMRATARSSASTDSVGVVRAIGISWSGRPIGSRYARVVRRCALRGWGIWLARAYSCGKRQR